MAHVYRTLPTELDLLEIARFIADRSGSDEQAERFIARIENACESYSRQPEMGEHCPQYGKDIRQFSIGNYVVVYKPHVDGILIVMVARGTRRLSRLLRTRLEEIE